MDIQIAGKTVRLQTRHAIGKGGEADIFLYQGKAIKIFKPPSHPDLTGNQHEQRAAKLRIQEHQTKLKAYPRNLPSHVVAPSELAFDKTGRRIVGYVMPFVDNAEVMLKYADRRFRESGIDPNSIAKILLHLRNTVIGLHKAGVVIGDFNDLNVMVKNDEAFLIDADSYQFGNYFCKLFTARFVDPLLCDKRFKRLQMSKPHNEMSDWYSFAVMVFETLLYVDPYGGIFRPKNKQHMIPHDSRPLKRITVFNSEVRYPKPALPLDVLPDELLQLFHQIFEKDKRGIFPEHILQQLRWTECSSCGKLHARAVCPFCSNIAESIKKEVIRITGTVTARRIFHTKGRILTADYQGGKIRYVFHQDNAFRREGDEKLIPGKLDPTLRFKIKHNETLIGKDRKVFGITLPSTTTRELYVDTVGRMPIFDTNGERVYWMQHGKIMRDGKLGIDFPESIGEALPDQTLLWIGETLGFGWYRAGNINVSFVFDPRKRGINDSVKLPTISGQLIDAQCIFSSSYCFLTTQSQEQGRTISRIIVIDRAGNVVACTSSDDPGFEWLHSIRGMAASNNKLFVPTDEGIKRVDVEGNSLQHKQTFVDTESYVTSASKLFVAKEGIYVVDSQDITLLTIK